MPLFLIKINGTQSISKKSKLFVHLYVIKEVPEICVINFD